jgi:glyoxylase-like metal-dependent hydrolase (beta-lactamase superfamily II)
MYELTPISDGILKTPEHAVIGLDQKIIRSHLNIDENGETFIPVYAFLYRLDQHVILCDTGSGHDMQPTLGRVPQSLHAQGIKPDDITHILLTHMHADHANGLIDQHGAAIYPNATLYIMREKLEHGDTQARKTYLRAVISKIEVDDHKIRIIGEKASLADVIAGKQSQNANVRGSVRKWRARKDSNL